MRQAVATLAICLLLAACDPPADGDSAAPASEGPILPIGLSGNQGVSAQDITGEYLADPGAGENWPSAGNGYANNRYSPLDELSAASLADFGMLWSAPLAEGEGHWGTPIAVDGRIYFGDPVYGATAWEATTGQRLWNYNPEIPSGVLTDLDCTQAGAAGVAVARGRIFFGQRDGRLTALDASTGAVLWSRRTTGEGRNAIVGVPLVVGNHIVVGSAPPCEDTAEGDSARGYVSGYIAQDGQLDWRFHTVPTGTQVTAAAARLGDGLFAEAARSWGALTPGQEPGGGFVPGNIAFDPVGGDLLFGTGERRPRPDRDSDGRALFTSSLIALDPETGRYRWHRQLAPGGVGWSANAPILFADLPISGDTDSEANEAGGDADAAQRRVRAAWLPLENGWMVGATEAAGYLGFAARYGGGYSPVEGYDGETYSATLAEEGELRTAEAVHDARYPASYSPQTGLFYLHRASVAEEEGREARRESLIAFSPSEQEALWQVEGAGPGALVTAGGLLFARYQAPFGPGLGLFDAKTGNLLYFRADIVPIGGFATFLAGGKQMVAFPALVDGRAQMVAMGLGGRARLDTPPAE